jgi:hypothetical protein
VTVEALPGLPVFQPRIKAAYEVCLENKIHVMMDSGVISWWSYRNSLLKKRNEKALAQLVGEEDFIRLYVEYVKKNHQKWDFFVTVDLEPKANDIFLRHERIEKMGIRPVPVFHGDDSTDYLKRYADKGYKLIAVAPNFRERSRTRHRQRPFLDAVFDVAEKRKLRLHGLAVTTPWMMLEYGWASVDSTAWSRSAIYGRIINFDEQTGRLVEQHVSDMISTHAAAKLKLNTTMLARLKKQLEAEGYDLEDLQKRSVARHIYNARTMSRLAAIAEKRHRTGWNLLF